MARIKLNSDQTLELSFDNFLYFKRAQGITERTLQSYSGHFKCISKHLDTSINISNLTRENIQDMIISMQDNNLSPNTISSYVRVFKVFLSWARDEGLTQITIPNCKGEETIKETYSDVELAKLLKKPKLTKARFSEYRTWVIINFLLNSGARASTVRNILIKDVDLYNGLITYRHNKNRRIQAIPLCSQMISILKEYMYYRKGEPDDFLFCNEDGSMLTANSLRSSIVRYNRRRGVSKTSIQLFRHTFAKKYLIDCGGDAFTLQRLLGHSTLEMTSNIISAKADRKPAKYINTLVVILSSSNLQIPCSELLSSLFQR